MKTAIVNSIIALAALTAAPVAHAAANKIQIPLVEEKVYDEKSGDKLCFYRLEVNLGDSKTAKPYQIMKEIEENRFEQVQNWHSVSINELGHLILKLTASSGAKKDVSCLASKELLLLN